MKSTPWCSGCFSGAARSWFSQSKLVCLILSLPLHVSFSLVVTPTPLAPTDACALLKSLCSVEDARPLPALRVSLALLWHWQQPELLLCGFSYQPGKGFWEVTPEQCVHCLWSCLLLGAPRLLFQDHALCPPVSRGGCCTPSSPYMSALTPTAPHTVTVLSLSLKGQEEGLALKLVMPWPCRRGSHCQATAGPGGC